MYKEYEKLALEVLGGLALGMVGFSFAGGLLSAASGRRSQ